jgi:hypothetical protein
MHNCVNALPAACRPEVLSHHNGVMRYFFAFFVFHLQMPPMIICNFRNKDAQKQHL